MPTTPEYGWVTPAASSANDVPFDLASLASQIEATVEAHKAEVDDVVDVSVATSVALTGKLTLIRMANVRELLLNAYGTVSAGNTNLGSGLVPADDRPKGSDRPGSVYFSGTGVGMMVVSTAGTVSVINDTGTSKSVSYGSVMWTI